MPEMSKKDMKKEYRKKTEKKSHKVDEELEALLADPKARFIVDLRDKRIHDKYCKAIIRIPAKKLMPSEQYRTDLWQCDYCAVDSYIKYGARDPLNLNAYKKFFEEIGISKGQLRFLYVNLEASTELKEDELIIYRGDDIWKISPRPESGKVVLYYNSSIVRRGKKVLSGEFRVPNEKMSDTYVKYALNYIKECDQENNDSSSDIANDAEILEQSEKVAFHGLVSRILDVLKEKKAKRELSEEKEVPDDRQEKAAEKADYRIEIDGFTETRGKVFPKKDTWCVYYWKTFEGEVSWDVGYYSTNRGSFSVMDMDGKSKRITPKNRVVAWKKMSDLYEKR